MRVALRKLGHHTINFLRNIVVEKNGYKSANEVMYEKTGIDTFFRDEADFTLFKSLIITKNVISEDFNRREYGDFQTPFILSNLVCFLLNKKINPEIIIEPTFGEGTFIISSIRHFNSVKRIYGIEIYEPYYWHTKFSILEYFLDKPNNHKPIISLFLDDIFNFNFGKIEASQKLLILGNPPWVTNSELGVLNSNNLPQKSNFKLYNGYEAITGKGNFDISEYIIIMLLRKFSKSNGHLAMLVKNAVIKNLMEYLPKSHFKIDRISALKFDAKKYFNASVKASLFNCQISQSDSSFICRVSNINKPDSIEYSFGWIDSKFVSNINSYKNFNNYDGISPITWRQGLKHDCAKIMELESFGDGFINGFNQKISIENDLVYSLLKSSDLKKVVINTTRKYVIVTQKKIGEDTSYISTLYPNLFSYLVKNNNLFSKRKSSIYRGKPLFSIFGIGEYSFKPYKIAISGFYKQPLFTLVLPDKNGKPIMFDDTIYFMSFDDLSEAVIFWTVLNSDQVKEFLKSITFIDAKRPYTKGNLMRIDLQRVLEDFKINDIINLAKNLSEDMAKYISDERLESICQRFNGKQLPLFTSHKSKRIKQKNINIGVTQHILSKGNLIPSSTDAESLEGSG
ncbi:MAG: hypothetical protein IIA61_04105 [Candidatus Marinimicrobia bacterium]|nr:hypothetical protein [Candidatus Neomarinimicrobiota bacterium]